MEILMTIVFGNHIVKLILDGMMCPVHGPIMKFMENYMLFAKLQSNQDNMLML